MPGAYITAHTDALCAIIMNHFVRLPADLLKAFIRAYFPPAYRAVILCRVCKRFNELAKVTEGEIEEERKRGWANFRDMLTEFLSGQLAHLDRWAKVVMKLKRSPPIEVKGRQGTQAWLNARRIMTASSAASKCGLGDYKFASDELYAVREGVKQETTQAMMDGHAYEDDVAWRAFRILFPVHLFGDFVRRWASGVFDKLDSRARLKCAVDRTTGARAVKLMGEICMWLMPLHKDWLSASPDRTLRCHPASTPNCEILLEVKYSSKVLYTRPKIEYLVQCTIQMYHQDGDWMFLVYGFRNNSAVVFLIEYNAALLDWLMPRMREFVHYTKHKKNEPGYSKFRVIKEMGHPLKDFWNGKEVDKSYKRELGYENVKKADFFPPQPKWSLVGFYIDPDDPDVRNYATAVMQHNPVEGPVLHHVFEQAIGQLYKRVGIKAVAHPMRMPIMDIIRESLVDEARVAKRKGCISEHERLELERYVRSVPVEENGKFTARLAFDEDTIDAHVSSDWARRFIRAYGTKRQVSAREGGDDAVMSEII